ncbi:Y-family DNA polymerase [Flavobacterium psychrotrophum]|uniref:Y-family DNA polymerase n=1 Tax=Flavobacterium psychrotrophum TaxID=2294119 RepID=UPI000E322A3A|nr:Y-family DNA polymerase [Flavobacterium psychrotrophum]
MYCLVDCNNFYASCERAFNPALRGVPIVVLSNNDGCVIARSYEAKDLGVPMGAPAFQYQQMFSQNNIKVFSSNYALYGDMSSRVMSILGEYTPDIEVYSIDEAFLKFDGFETYYNYRDYGQVMHGRLLRGTGIPVGLGFAPTKALAKLANRIAKKFPELKSVHVIDTEEKRIKALKWLSIEDVWGIGRQHAARLLALKIRTAWDFTQLPEEWVRKHMSVVGLRLQRDLKGLPTIGKEEVKDKKNIACTRSFEAMTTDFNYLKERVATYAATVAEKLRRDKLHAGMVTVFLQTNRFRLDQPMYNPVVNFPIEFPTNSSIEIIRIAQLGLDRIFRTGYHYKKAGVIVTKITPATPHQVNLFLNEDPRHQNLMQAIDTFNRNNGKEMIKFGGMALDRKWKMKQESLSPMYTTRYSEVVTVKCK